MKWSFLHRTSAWAPTIVVLVVVLAAGSRLIVLSVEHHAEEKRTAAQAAVTESAQTIEAQLRRLHERARRGDEGPGLRVTADGRVQNWDGSNPAVAAALLDEWEATGNPQGAGFIGPVRYGSQWIVATRVRDREDAAGAGWSVAYASLDELLSGARLGELVQSGYHFEVAQALDPASRRVRVFSSSRTGQLREPVTHRIALPRELGQASRSAFLQLSVLPRTGWYPVRELATSIGLLALTAWLLAFGTHDLVHSLQRTRSVLKRTRQKLHTANHRLVEEIEQRHQLQRSFEHARYHDAFTGLPNRRYFMDQLDRALRDVRSRRRRGLAIVLIDIDRFRLINDTLGHTAGDELVVQVARRFEKAMEGHDCVLARWSGDQFAVLVLDVTSREAALAVATELQEALHEPLELRRHRLSVAASAGVACIESGLQRAEDALREADIALSVAKKREASRTVAYAPAMGGDAASLVSLEADLHVALEKNELRLLFQPVVDLRSARQAGVEALLRWRHPVEGVLPPDRFVPIAEEAGLIVPITRWIIQRAAHLAADWRRRLPPSTDFYISVNLSPGALRDSALCRHVALSLEEARTPPSCLKFELTERGLISNVGIARETLHGFQQLGIELMLDDFGTGYSSLSHLQMFPFDYVKIDRPFVDRPGAERANTAVAAAIVQIASSLGLKAIAEVVETEAAARAVQEMGCHFGQGFFFGMPVEAEEALRNLRAHGEDDSPTLVLPAVGSESPPSAARSG